MKTVQMIKWGKGYYVTKRNGCNADREWVRTKAEATKKVATAKKEGYEVI